MARNKNKKQKIEKKKKKINVKLNKKKPESNPAMAADSDSSDSETQSVKIQKLLEPYSKEQLIEFLSDAALSDASLLNSIRTTADRDISHRKIFIHGFGWDTTREIIISAFESYGEIEECNVVVDKATGKAKGYGFVLFKTRAGAAKALKQPQKKIKNRTTFCQLASVGPAPTGQGLDTAGRKIYVSNVHANADPDKLHAFFSRFGEIETGPLGFDQLTGKSRGYALIIYKAQEGANKALEEPHKMFDGHQLHCQKASDSAQKVRAAPITAQQPLPGPAVLAAAAAAQNMALFTHNPSLNPAFNALLANPTAGLIAGNSLVSGPGATAGFGGYGVSAHGLGGLNGSQSVLGAYGAQGLSLQGYQGTQFGQSSGGRAYTAGGSLSGIPPYI